MQLLTSKLVVYSWMILELLLSHSWNLLVGIDKALKKILIFVLISEIVIGYVEGVEKNGKEKACIGIALKNRSVPGVIYGASKGYKSCGSLGINDGSADIIDDLSW